VGVSSPLSAMREVSDVVARFHGGHLDGQLIAEWPDPPGRSVWAERVTEGVIVTEAPDSEHQDPSDPESRGFDHYALAEVIADLAVYHFTEKPS
jgi:hypothetical protein